MTASVGRKDVLLAAVWALLVLGLLAPSWFQPSSALANFGDLYAYHYPLRHLAFSAVQAGRLPFWNPYVLGGLPLAANPQSVLFYPAALAAAIWPLGLALSWDYAFHLFWGGLGWAFLARRSGLKPEGAWLLAVLYALSPFLVYRITEGIPTILAALSWCPWCWLAWLSGRRGLLAGAWALQFFSGHPQLMAVNAAAMGLWSLFRPQGRNRGLGALAVAGLAVMALTAVLWPQLREFMSHSVRQAWPEMYATGYSVDLRTLATWLSPDAWGNPLDKTYAGPPSVFFETAALHIGVAGLALAAAGLWLGRSPAALALIAAGLFLALGGHNPAYSFLLNHSPLGLLRTPARYLFLCFWGLLLGVGSAVRRIEAAPGIAPRLRWLILLVALLELGRWDRRFLGTADAAPYLRPNQSLAGQVGAAPFRIMTDPELANPNKTMLYRAMNVNGYEAFYLAGYPEYAARSEGHAAADASRTYLRRYASPEMKRLGVAYYLDARGELLPSPGALPLAFFLAPNQTPVRDSLAVSIVRPERWRVAGRRPASAKTLVLSLPFYPGWRAWVNGAELSPRKWDGFLQAAEFPESVRPGEAFELWLDYKPSGWGFCAVLTVAAWAVWLALQLQLAGKAGSKA